MGNPMTFPFKLILGKLLELSHEFLNRQHIVWLECTEFNMHLLEQLCWVYFDLYLPCWSHLWAPIDFWDGFLKCLEWP